MTIEEVSCLLKLGSKYDVACVRDWAIRRLEEAFPEKLGSFVTPHTSSDLRFTKGFDAERYNDLVAIRLSHKDCIMAIHLARQFDLNSVLPAAFYACAQLPPETLACGYEDKKHAHWRLSDGDLSRCLKGQKCLREASVRSYGWFLEWTPKDALSCEDADDGSCAYSVKEDKIRILAHLEGMFDHVLIDSDRLDRQLIGKYCSTCLKSAKRRYDRERTAAWKDLRKYFDLPKHDVSAKPVQTKSELCEYTIAFLTDII